jgi:hypothetical protein
MELTTMLKTKKCAECGAEIIFQYIKPSKSFRVENGQIIRDDAWTGPEFDNPYFHYQCSEDSEHRIDPNDELLEWFVDVEQEFKDGGHYDD